MTKKICFKLLAVLFVSLSLLPSPLLAGQKKKLPTFYLNHMGVIAPFEISSRVMSLGCSPLVVAEKKILLGRYRGLEREGVTQINGQSLSRIKKKCPFTRGQRIVIKGVLLENEKVMALEIKTTEG
ncbi:MAG: hypothetical protein MI742_15125 [Desulfobacterales bacterium]|nr:hypothetical protein [Desulfobacterales bacterium]